MVRDVLKSKEGGKGAHYRVLGIPQNGDDSAIKKAYRKLALRLHPDKNSAPEADEAFKAVGLAYATLSDSQKRAVYDRYGDEDPDNRGGGGGGGMGRNGQNMNFNGQEVSPEDLFNMFFGGGMPGGMAGGARGFGGPGFRVHTTGGFGGRQPRRPGQQQGQPQQAQAGLQQILQLLPLIMLFLLSFFNFPGETGTGATGGSTYFSLTVSDAAIHMLESENKSYLDATYCCKKRRFEAVGRPKGVTNSLPLACFYQSSLENHIPTFWNFHP